MKFGQFMSYYKKNSEKNYTKTATRKLVTGLGTSIGK